MEVCQIQEIYDIYGPGISSSSCKLLLVTLRLKIGLNVVCHLFDGGLGRL